MTGGGKSDEKQYLNKDYKTYQGYGDKAKVRVDCDNRTNRCISTLLFTAPKYGKSYTISIKGTSAIDSTELTTAPSSVTIHKPQMLYIEKKASESNPMLFTLTPKFDTVIPASAKLNLKWNATGSDILDSNNKWLPAELDNKSLTNNARSYNYTFPKSGNYVIDVQVTGDVFDGTLEKAENYDGSILKLDQSVAGSYFVYSLNTFAAQVTFNTDYEIRVNGTPVPTTYVYSITGPTKANINASNTTKVNSTDKTFITAKNFGTYNNVRLLFGGTYTVELEVYQTSLYNNGNINEAAKVEGVNYKKLTLPQNQSISIPSLSIEFSRKNANVDKTWYEDSYFGMKAGSIPVDSSLFTCVWTLDNNTPSSMKLSYILPVTAQNAQRSITTDCSKKIYAYGFGEGSGTVNLNLRIHNGPAYTTNNNTGSLLDDNRSINYTLY